MYNKINQPPDWWPHSHAAWLDIFVWFSNVAPNTIDYGRSVNAVSSTKTKLQPSDRLTSQLTSLSNWIKLTTGLSNDSYHFLFPVRSLFIKVIQQNKRQLAPLLPDDSSRLFLYLNSQPNLSELLPNQLLATSNVQIFEWIETISLISYLDKEGFLTRLGQKISKLHSVQINSSSNCVSWSLKFPQYIKRYYLRALAQSPKREAEIESIMARIAPLINDYQPSCFCHNDLNPSNLLVAKDGHLKIIDWEYASIGDPLFDLAGLIVTHQLNKVQEKELLKGYLNGNKIQLSTNKLNNMKALFEGICTLWNLAN
jgi:thiamine kinase-like enzyme